MIVLAAAAAVVLILLVRKQRIRRSVFIVLLLVNIAGAVMTVPEMADGGKEQVRDVPMEELKDAESMPLEVRTGSGEQYDITIQAPDIVYSAGEAEQILEEAASGLEEMVRGKNHALSEVRWNLNLKTSLPDSPVEIEWDTEPSGVIDYDGTILPGVPREGTDIKLTGALSLQGQKDTWERVIRVYPSRETEGIKEEILRETEKENEEENGKSDTYRLPEQAGGRELVWYRSRGKRGIVLSLFSVILALLAAASAREKQDRAQKARTEQMMRDYPELISKIQLYLGAGLSMRLIFGRIGSSYQKRRSSGGPRQYAYEEICHALHLMESGKTELEAYDAFGTRCGIPCYRGLALLLTQNLKKGGAGIMPLLEREVQEAFETRKRNARAEGEKATVRLLLPMAMMLVIVMALILIPAFMSL